jgi:hypothetical protein
MTSLSPQQRTLPATHTSTVSTASTDFPVTTGAYTSTYQGGASDAFLVELNAAGSGLVHSTYLGGSGEEVGYGIASDFPTTAGVAQGAIDGNYDAFVTAVNPTGSALLYSTFLGGSNRFGRHTYVTGYTNS